MNQSNDKQDNLSSPQGRLAASEWNTVASELLSAVEILGGPDDSGNQLGKLLSLMTYMTVHRDVSSGPNQLKIDINFSPEISLQDGATFKFVATRTYNEDPTCVVGTNTSRPLVTPSGETIKNDVIIEGGLYMLYYRQSLGKFVVYGISNNAGGVDNPIWRGYF